MMLQRSFSAKMESFDLSTYVTVLNIDAQDAVIFLMYSQWAHCAVADNTCHNLMAARLPEAGNLVGSTQAACCCGQADGHLTDGACQHTQHTCHEELALHEFSGASDWAPAYGARHM
jgi:hypothetical protein